MHLSQNSHTIFFTTKQFEGVTRYSKQHALRIPCKSIITGSASLFVDFFPSVAHCAFFSCALSPFMLSPTLPYRCFRQKVHEYRSSSARKKGAPRYSLPNTTFFTLYSPFRCSLQQTAAPGIWNFFARRYILNGGHSCVSAAKQPQRQRHRGR